MNNFNSLLDKHMKNLTKAIKEDSEESKKVYSESEMTISPEDADESEVRELLRNIREEKS